MINWHSNPSKLLKSKVIFTIILSTECEPSSTLHCKNPLLTRREIQVCENLDILFRNEKVQDCHETSQHQSLHQSLSLMNLMSTQEKNETTNPFDLICVFSENIWSRPHEEKTSHILISESWLSTKSWLFPELTLILQIWIVTLSSDFWLVKTDLNFRTHHISDFNYRIIILILKYKIFNRTFV